MIVWHESEDKTWSVLYSLGSLYDLYDLSWSGGIIICGSTDRSLTLSSVKKRGWIQTIHNAHSLQIQGVTTDPRGTYFVSMAADRTAKLFKRKGEKWETLKTFRRRKTGGGGTQSMFLDETANMYANREKIAIHHHISTLIGYFFHYHAMTSFS